MSAEDDILFFAPASITKPTRRRKLPYVYDKNKISITMCNVSRGGGSLEKRPHDVFHGLNRYSSLIEPNI
jgi:hypothetical protein